MVVIRISMNDSNKMTVFYGLPNLEENRNVKDWSFLIKFFEADPAFILKPKIVMNIKYHLQNI